MNKTRIKDYVSMIKKLAKNSSRPLMVARDDLESRVYFCDGCTILSIPNRVYDDLLSTGEKVLEVNQQNADLIAGFIKEYEKTETQAARVVPFIYDIHGKTCNIIKSVSAAGETVFTLVSSFYFSIMETLDKFSVAPVLTATKDANKKPVSICDASTGAIFIVLPVHHTDLAETVKRAFDLF